MKVLILEPDVPIKDFLVMMFDSLDIEHLAVNSIKEAKAALKSGTINLVVSERLIEKTSSIELYNFIKAEQIPSAFVLFTKDPLKEVEEYRRFQKESKYNYYIPKPYKDAEFLAMIEEVEDNIDAITPPELPEERKNQNVINDRLKGSVAKQEKINESPLKLNLEKKGEKNNTQFKTSVEQDPLAKEMEITLDPESESREPDYSEKAAEKTKGLSIEMLEQDLSEEWEIQLDPEREPSELSHTDEEESARKELNLTTSAKGLTREKEISTSSTDNAREISDNSSEAHLSEKMNLVHNTEARGLGSDAREIPYLSIKINRFYNFSKLPFSVYQKLENNKFFKIINENDEYRKAKLQSYQDKGVKNLYIDSIYYKDFISLFVARISQKLAMAPKNKKNFVASQVILTDVIFEEVSLTGFSDSTFFKAKNIIASVIEFYTKEESISHTLEELAFCVNYVSEHSIHLALIACELCEESDWQSPHILQNLCIAAVFHDIAFKDRELAAIYDQHDKNIDEKQRNEILRHPQAAIDMLDGVSFISDEVKSIILDHHEKPDGSGFPSGRNATNISPISALFIIAHEYAIYINKQIDEPQYKDKKNFLTYLKKTYNRGNFQSPLRAFLNRYSESFENT